MGVSGQRHALAAFTSGKERVHIEYKIGWGPWVGLERWGKSCFTGIRSPDFLAPSESQYRLHYPGQIPVYLYPKISLLIPFKHSAVYRLLRHYSQCMFRLYIIASVCSEWILFYLTLSCESRAISSLDRPHRLIQSNIIPRQTSPTNPEQYRP